MTATASAFASCVSTFSIKMDATYKKQCGKVYSEMSLSYFDACIAYTVA